MYGSGTFIESMTTPYGTTHFSTTGGTSNGNGASIQATDPMGYTERTEYRVQAPSVPFSVGASPAGMSTFNSWLNYRNSFYWNKDQYASACTTNNGTASCDYTHARIKHFLHTPKGRTSRYLESVKYPLEARIWYNYPDQTNGPLREGSLAKPTHIGRVLDNGTTQLKIRTYNARGNVTGTIDPDGRKTVYSYAPNGIDLIEIRRKNGSGFDALAQYSYNNQHQPLTYTNAAGQTTSYTYNARGQRTSITNPLGHTTTYTYNSNGYLTTITNALGHVQYNFTYDAKGRVATDTDSWGYTRSYSYDALNRITQIAYPDGSTRTFAWNRLDLASVTDRQGNTTTYTYDANRNLTSITDPTGFVTHLTYYPSGKLHTLTDPKGNVTTWTRDIEGRVIAKTYADGNGNGNTYTYDSTSRLASKTDALGQTTTYSYDPADLLTDISYINAVNPTPNVTYSYGAAYPRLVAMSDGLGSTTFSYVPAGATGALKLASENGPFSSNDNVSYVYDALDRLIERTTDQTDHFTYDALGRITSETNPLGTFHYSYLGDTSEPTKQTLSTPNNTTGYRLNITYNGNLRDRQLRRLIYREPLALVPTRRMKFTHSKEHQVLTKSDFSGATQLTHINGYTYDDNYRLTAMTAAPLPADSYNYDAADNLVSYDLNNGIGGSASVNNLNQLATVNGVNWHYDANGSLTDDGTYQYAWDAASRLISVVNIATGHVTRFAYDGLDRRLVISEQDGAPPPTVTRYLWCGNTLCGARDGNNAVTASYYTQGEIRNGIALHYVKNQIGSIVGVMNAHGQALGNTLYSAYGVVKLSAGVRTDFGYAGMLYNEATGLYLTKYRAYRPSIGRWLSRDPIAEAGGVNLYAYALDNPANLVDRDGRFAIAAAVPAVVGGVIGGISGAVGAAVQGGDSNDILIGATVGVAAGAGAAYIGSVAAVGTIGQIIINGVAGSLGNIAGQAVDPGGPFNLGSLVGSTVGGMLGGTPGVALGRLGPLVPRIGARMGAGIIGLPADLTASSVGFDLGRHGASSGGRACFAN